MVEAARLYSELLKWRQSVIESPGPLDLWLCTLGTQQTLVKTKIIVVKVEMKHESGFPQTKSNISSNKKHADEGILVVGSIGSTVMTRPARVCICLACPQMGSFAFFPTASYLFRSRIRRCCQFGANIYLETNRSLVQVVCCRVPVWTEQ